MFNFASVTNNFRSERIFGGLNHGDADSYRTLYAGPDPANSNRMLVRRIIQLSDSTYAYEETRVTRNKESKQPSVHTTISKIAGFDLKENVSAEEASIRGQHRAMPNVLGFSLYYRKTNSGLNHFSIVENSLWKTQGSSWSEWWQNFHDRRDMSRYLRQRWISN